MCSRILHFPEKYDRVARAVVKWGCPESWWLGGRGNFSERSTRGLLRLWSPRTPRCLPRLATSANFIKFFNGPYISLEWATLCVTSMSSNVLLSYLVLLSSISVVAKFLHNLLQNVHWDRETMQYSQVHSLAKHGIKNTEALCSCLPE